MDLKQRFVVAREREPSNFLPILGRYVSSVLQSMDEKKIHRRLLSFRSHAGASLFLVTAMCELTRVYLCMRHPGSWT